MKRALISVTDKSGLQELGAGLLKQGYELVSTGGTAAKLREFGHPVTDVSQVTKFPEMMDGRVKTLHPAIFAGILARSRNPQDLHSLAQHGLDLFDVVVVNLYAFEEKAKDKSLSFDDLVEHIDIGGPSLIRAAAKNWRRVWVVTDPRKYPHFLAVLASTDEWERLAVRFVMMSEAFRLTTDYDRAIHSELVDGVERVYRGEVTRRVIVRQRSKS